MLVCSGCKGKNVQVPAWIDANTNEYKGEYPDDAAWCDDCEEYVKLEILNEQKVREIQES